MEILGNSGLLGQSGYDMAGGDEKLMAFGSLVTGIGLFILSMIIIFAIGCFAGAMVLTERLARRCIDDDCEETKVAAALPASAEVV
jgi:hypothetical protein